MRAFDGVEGNTLLLAIIGVSQVLKIVIDWIQSRVATRRQISTQTKLNNLSVVSKQIHTLTNSRYGEQLKINVSTMRALVTAFTKTKEDDPRDNIAGKNLKQAEDDLRKAEMLLHDHENQQNQVDAGPQQSSVSQSTGEEPKVNREKEVTEAHSNPI